MCIDRRKNKGENAKFEMDFNLIPQYSDIKAITEIGGVLESLILLYKASYLFDIKELI